MTKETVWTIAENLSISYKNGDREAVLLAYAPSQDNYASFSLPESTLMELQTAIREILNQFPTDP